MLRVRKYLKLIKMYRKEILFLSYQSVKTKYLETVFGLAWAIVKPLTFVITLWFAFTTGFRHGAPINGVPFMLTLLAAYIPWSFVSETVNSGTGVLRSNAILVKTIKFPVMALPLINVLSILYVHIVLMLIVFVMYVVVGGMSYLPTIYYFNFLYYWLTMIVFFTGLTFITSSLTVVLKDIGPLVSAIMQPMFWFTPIWYNSPDEKFELMERILNPLYYFVQGYKFTLVQRHFFWENGWYNVYIWFLIILIYIAGLKLFKKIRPLMADMI